MNYVLFTLLTPPEAGNSTPHHIIHSTLHSRLPTPHSSLHNFLSIPLALHPTLHTSHSPLHTTLHTVHASLHFLHSSPDAVHSSLYNLHSTLHTTLRTHFPLRSADSTLYSYTHNLSPVTPPCTLQTPAVTLFTPLCTLQTSHWTLFTLHSTLHPFLLDTPHAIPLLTLDSLAPQTLLALYLTLQTAFFPLQTSHFPSLHSTLYTAHSIPHILHCIVRIAHPSNYTPHSFFTRHTSHSSTLRTGYEGKISILTFCRKGIVHDSMCFYICHINICVSIRVFKQCYVECSCQAFLFSQQTNKPTGTWRRCYVQCGRASVSKEEMQLRGRDYSTPSHPTLPHLETMLS